MPDYTEILTQMVETDANNSRWLFNLLEVLTDKKILNAADLEYIRDHGKENKNEN